MELTWVTGRRLTQLSARKTRCSKHIVTMNLVELEARVSLRRGDGAVQRDSPT